jgi:hypothetical protein
MSLTPTTDYNHISKGSQGAVDVAIPESLMSSRVPKAIPSLSRIVSTPSQSGNASQSGTVVFQIAGGNASNGFLKAGSAYLRGTCTVTKTAGGNANNDICFANQTASASSLINRFQLSANSTAIETVNRYDNYHAVVSSQGTNSDVFLNDCSIQEFANTRIVSGVATTAIFNFAFPLKSAVLSNIKSFPLFLSNLFIQLDLNSAELAFKVGGTGATFGASYVLSNMELVYEIQNVDTSLIDGMRQQMMATGKLFEMPMTCALGLQSSFAAGSTAFSYNVGLNLASVQGVLLAEVATTAATTNSETANIAPVDALALTNLNSFIRNSTEANTNSRRFYIDSKQLISYDVALDAQVFNETQRVFASLYDDKVSAIAPRGVVCAPGVSTGAYYVVGQSSRRFDEADLCMTGTPCQNLVLQINKSGVPVASSVYIYVIYDQILVIDATGSVALAK